MQSTLPPFRADMVGSLLRTTILKEARKKFAMGEISTDKLREVEDKEIRNIIKRQEGIGFQARRFNPPRWFGGSVSFHWR